MPNSWISQRLIGLRQPEFDCRLQTACNILASAALTLLLLVVSAAANPAHARQPIPPWCAWDSGVSNFNCGYYTYQSCMADAWGNGGLCVRNPRAAYGDARVRRRR